MKGLIPVYHSSLSTSPAPATFELNLFRNRKAQGEWAEIVFLAKAIALGFTVSKPYGDNLAFDFVVRAAGRTSYVQVKSGWARTHGAYQIRTSHLVRQSRKGGRRINRAYRKTEVDFIVAFIVPENAWYVIPVAAVQHTPGIAVFPHVDCSRGKYERFREAWHLLAAPQRAKEPGMRKKLAALGKRRRPGRAPHHPDEPRARKARIAWRALGEWLFHV